MASSRKTGTNEDCRNDADTAWLGAPGKYGTGRDFTSLQNWEVDNDVDCVTETKSPVLELYDDVAEWSDNMGNMGGATTNSTYQRYVRAASGEGHDGTPNNGVTVKNSSNSTQIIAISGEDYDQVQDIIFTKPDYTGPFNTTTLTTSALGAPGVKSFQAFIGVIVFNINHASQSPTGIQCAKGQLVNCLIHNVDDWGVRHTANPAYSYNVTITNCGGDGFGATIAGHHHLKNVLSSGNTGDDFATGGTYTNTDYCAASDTTAEGANSRDSQTFTFEDSGGDDFHLASGDGGAKDFGVDLSGDSTYAFDDDIDGATRTGSWDIGCDEFTTSVTAPTSHLRGPLYGALEGPT